MRPILAVEKPTRRLVFRLSPIREASETDMGVRRKGERPVPKKIRDYLPGHPVARRIAEGDPWLNAWIGQMATPWPTLTRKARIASERLEQLNRGADPTDAEIEALAGVWRVPPAGLRASIEESWVNGDKSHLDLLQTIEAPEEA